MHFIPAPLKPFTENLSERSEKLQPPIVLEDGSMKKEMKKNVNQNRSNEQTQYLANWAGYTDHEYLLFLKVKLKTA